MTGIIVAFAQYEQAVSIRSLLARAGHNILGIATAGAQVLSMPGNIGGGLVVCGYKLADMLYSELLRGLPEDYEMLMLAHASKLAELPGNERVHTIEMPFPAYTLVSEVNDLVRDMEWQHRPGRKSAEEQAVIARAKKLLMSKGMTEPQAHRYLQTHSMDTGTGIVECAQMVIMMGGQE